ncbi:NAD(P)/FAD-dependent oxidoreductase [Amycolatopsis sp. CA-230715]|uniref:NAD(P)/FAD-dependent oxidoreductase n=1 Tax=Amycolatopsis sp. CA-230715 TaxID=2745196 RepID=UPI001C026701|nr:FAD-binding oxidoreductase [Amycolatopsis sp. CA-230715]QWF84412.1 D-amino acid dehydrogenase [Amycolatopsis sp. CA-230715]
MTGDDRTSQIPESATCVVVGAGVHGLSTAWHLAKQTRKLGRTPDIVVLDKTAVGAGASGIACGVVRNNYFQPAMRELMAHSVRVWEEHADELSYHPVGYLQISPERMAGDVAGIHEQQRAIGYESVFVDGAAATRRYLRALFPDWRAEGVTNVLHEKRGGYANNMASVRGLARMARAEGVRIVEGVRVRGMRRTGGAVTAVRTDAGEIRCEHVVVAAGPWIREVWRMLGQPDRVGIPLDRGAVFDSPMWTYWALQEGTLKVEPEFLADAGGAAPPVIHVDSDVPLYDERGELVTDSLWGVYFKPDANFGGVQGGTAPNRVDRPYDEVAVDPYGPASPEFVVGEAFARTWTAALAHCLGRFEGTAHLLSREPSGGLGCFTPDSFPVFDTVGENVSVIADSNHGYKMIGVGELVAKEILGAPQALLEPFRLSRFAEGRLHPVSSSPFPWS